MAGILTFQMDSDVPDSWRSLLCMFSVILNNNLVECCYIVEQRFFISEP